MMWRLAPFLVLLILMNTQTAIADWGDDTFTDLEIRALIISLDDEDEWVRRCAVENLGRVEPTSGMVISALIRALSSENGTIRNEACRSLERIGSEAVPYLLEALDNGSGYVLELSIQSLGDIGPEHGVIPALCGMLHHENSLMRVSAVEALGSMRKGAADAIPDLVGVLFRDKDATVRQAAATALGTIGGNSDAAIDALIDVSCDIDIRDSCSKALIETGVHVVPNLLYAIDSDCANIRIACIQALGEFTDDAACAIPRLMEALKDPCPEVRPYAASALGKIGPVTTEVIPALIWAVEAGMDDLSMAAAEALACIGKEAMDAVDVLVDALLERNYKVARKAVIALGKTRTDDPCVIRTLCDVYRSTGDSPPEAAGLKYDVISVFGDIGAPAIDAIPILIKTIEKTDSPYVIGRAALSLGQIGFNEPGVVQVLIKLLEHEHKFVRSHCLQAFVGHESELKGFMPIFVDLLEDEDWWLFTAAEKFVVKFGTDAIPLMIEGLKEAEPIMKTRYISALAKYGPDARDAVPYIIEALDFDAQHPALYAVRALGAIGSDADEIILALELKLEDCDDGAIRNFIFSVIGSFGIDARQAIPYLIDHARNNKGDLTKVIITLGRISPEPEVISFLLEQLENESAGVREVAALSLGRLGENAGDVVPALIVMLNDMNYSVREETALALGAFGTEAMEAIPALTASIEDKNCHVRIGATFALGQITGDFAKTLPVIIDAIVSGDPDMIYSATLRINAMGAEACDALPALLYALGTSSNEWVTFYLIRTIGDIGPDASAALDELRAIAREYSRPGPGDIRSRIVQAAEEAIAKIEGTWEGEES